MLEAIAFYTLAAVIIGFGVLVVTTSNPVHCVLFLAADFLCVAMLYVLLAAELLAVIQTLIYVGGVVVLYLFVVMLVNRGDQPDVQVGMRGKALLGLGLGALLLAEISTILMYSAVHPPNIAAAARPAATSGNTEAAGMLLYTDYLVPFEVASLLLVAALAGAIVLARKETHG